MTAATQEAQLRRDGLRAAPLAWFALAGVIAYVIIDVLLAFLRPRYSLLYNAESDYGRGPWSWVMDANFLLRCALSLALVGALSRAIRPDARARAGLVLLAISLAGAAAYLLLGAAAGHKHAPGGLYERIFLGLELLWIALAAVYIAVRRPG